DRMICRSRQLTLADGVHPVRQKKDHSGGGNVRRRKQIIAHTNKSIPNGSRRGCVIRWSDRRVCLQYDTLARNVTRRVNYFHAIYCLFYLQEFAGEWLLHRYGARKRCHRSLVRIPANDFISKRNSGRLKTFDGVLLRHAGVDQYDKRNSSISHSLEVYLLWNTILHEPKITCLQTFQRTSSLI